MATVQTGSHEYVERREAKFAVSGSMGETICGIAALVLAIIGIASSHWVLLGSLATIAVGAALAFAGISTAPRPESVESGSAENEFELGAVSAEFLGGVAAIVLGILALLGIASDLLISAAVIVAGASLIVGSMSTKRALMLASFGASMSSCYHIARESAVSQSLVGLSALVLGIVALVNESLTLDLIGLLVIGAGVLVLGSAVSSRLFLALTRR
jgi:hypothetical protein